jgi:hypothetical protein
MNQVDICNNALREIGATPITSFLDNTIEAELCNQFYEQTRDELLEDYPWSFALKRQELALVVGNPLYQYKYMHELPYDLLRLFHTNIHGDYTVEGTNLLSNQESVYAIYISRVTDSSKFTSQFSQAFIKAMVAKLIFPITKRERLVEPAMAAARGALENAKSSDAQQSPGPTIRSNILIHVRGHAPFNDYLDSQW